MSGVNSIDNLISTVQSIDRGMIEGDFVRFAVEKHQDEIVAKNVSQLYDRGENSLGVRLDSFAPYSKYTMYIKNTKGQPVDRVTLRDTGSFHSSFKLIIGATEFYVTATDEKTEKLVDKYGEEIFGLNSENRNKIALNLLFPTVIKQIKEKLYGRS